jgi:small acid-soluble spore protein (thioredoxin-like protein)
LKHNPDNRSDNVDHLQKHIDNTVRRMNEADEMIRATDNDKTKEELSAKNDRRAAALDAFRDEIKDEADSRDRKS